MMRKGKKNRKLRMSIRNRTIMNTVTSLCPIIRISVNLDSSSVTPAHHPVSLAVSSSQPNLSFPSLPINNNPVNIKE